MTATIRRLMLITDVRLPGGLNGLALARAARRLRPDLRILLVGADVEALVAQGLAGVADQTLGKPFTIEDLEARVRRLLPAV